MDKNKQIEKLAEAIFLNCHACLFEDEAKMIAEFVINEQGYRKASEIVEKIFAEIESSLMYDGKYIGHISQKNFERLKKKCEFEVSWIVPTHTCQVEIPYTIESIANLAFSESENNNIKGE